jgi:hypothetical protein
MSWFINLIDEQLFIYFPFQVYEFKECQFVTEYKSLNGMNCYKNGYRYFKKLYSEIVNIDCYNLKYSVRLNKIWDRCLLDQKKSIS